jgi:hypothetical protein
MPSRELEHRLPPAPRFLRAGEPKLSSIGRRE